MFFIYHFVGQTKNLQFWTITLQRYYIYFYFIIYVYICLPSMFMKKMCSFQFKVINIIAIFIFII